MLPEFLYPFGPYHIVILHLPIGLLVGVLVVECFTSGSRDKQHHKSLASLHFALLFSTLLTVALGIAYENYGAYEEEIRLHRLWGFLFAGSVLISFLLFWLQRIQKNSSSRFLYILGLILTSFSMTVTGHLGGQLVHGKGFLSLTSSAEAPAQSTVSNFPKNTGTQAPEKVDDPAETAANITPLTSARTEQEKERSDPPSSSLNPDNTTEEEIVEPPVTEGGLPFKDTPDFSKFMAAKDILQRNCFSCHGATKQKGGYRVDSKQAIYRPGKSSRTPVATGDPNHSYLYQRVLLPRSHDDAMPPEEKDPLSGSDIEALYDWILAGAYWPTDEEMRKNDSGGTQPHQHKSEQRATELSAMGAKVECNTWGAQSVWIDLSVVHPGKLEKAIAGLKGFETDLVWLDLSKQTPPDSFYADLQSFKNLERLHLDGSTVTDRNLTALQALDKLKYLNLYNTAITDKAVDSLLKIPALTKVFLNQTKMSNEAVERLRRKKPSMQVIHGQPLPMIPPNRRATN